MNLAAKPNGAKVTGGRQLLAHRNPAMRRLKASVTAMQYPPEIAGKALAYGLRMVMMGALSCGATGTRPRGTS